MMDKIKFINQRIKQLDQQIQLNNQIQNEAPKSLFKYRPFDEHTFDMFDKRYVYLCPAEKLDDPTECMVSVDWQRLYKFQSNGVIGLTREVVDQLINLFIKPYTSSDNYEISRSEVYRIMNPNGTVCANELLSFSLRLQEYVPSDVAVKMVNDILAIQKELAKPNINAKFEQFVVRAINARKDMGICSFSENNDNEYMWKNYAMEYSGYCIEYDIENYENNEDILPVIYQDERETNVFVQLIGSFIGEYIGRLSNGKITPDRSDFLRLFLTKYKKWEYQNEWRLIGHAGEKPTAPIIKRVYLGEKVSPENEQKMFAYAEKIGFEVLKRG